MFDQIQQADFKLIILCDHEWCYKYPVVLGGKKVPHPWTRGCNYSSYSEELASWACDLFQSRPHAQLVLCLAQCSAVAFLKFLVALYLNLHYVNKTQRDKSLMQYRCPLLLSSPLLTAFTMTPKPRILVNPWWVEVLRASISYIYELERGTLTALRGHTFHSN